MADKPKLPETVEVFEACLVTACNLGILKSIEEFRRRLGFLATGDRAAMNRGLDRVRAAALRSIERLRIGPDIEAVLARMDELDKEMERKEPHS